MSDNLTVFYTEKFNEDFEEIFSFISEDSDKNARKFAGELKTVIERIIKYPQAGTIETRIEAKNNFYRFKTVMKRWKVIYKLTDRTLSFLCIIHSKRSSSEYEKIK